VLSVAFTIKSCTIFLKTLHGMLRSTNTSDWRHIRCPTHVSVGHWRNTDPCDCIQLLPFSQIITCVCVYGAS